MTSRRNFTKLASLAATAVLAGSTAAEAAPALRAQVDQRGDFVLFGNTLGYDCGNNTPTPTVGTVGDCGNSWTLGDTGIDVFWRSDSPSAGAASASVSVDVANARSTAILQLPSGAQVTYARVYWGAQIAQSAAADTAITIDAPGSAGTTVTADASKVVDGTSPVARYYQSTADVTQLVKAAGPGAYRISGVATRDARNQWALIDQSPETLYAGWSIVVLYRLDSDPPRNLAVFDGLDLVQSGAPATASLNGFLVPNAGWDAKLGVIAYEGDHTLTGDGLVFNGSALSNATNPANNFFNGSRSYLGTAVSNVGDLPQVTGESGSMSSVDLDVVDVKSLVSPGDTSATFSATSSQDTYLLGAFVTSIATYKPNFIDSTKSYVDLTRSGSIRRGDVIEYTITAVNDGNDASKFTVLTDPLPQGLTYEPGSLQIVSGTNAGAKTDAKADDQGEYDAATRTITVRLGAGADGSQGGSMAVNETAVVKFRAKIDASGPVDIDNQGSINAAGAQGAVPTDFPTDGNGSAAGNPPTGLVVDDCDANADCGGATPFCITAAHPYVCVQCLDSNACGGTKPVCNASHVCVACSGDGAPSCTDAAHPACLPSGACGECSATNDSICDATNGVKPVCLANSTCGCAADVDCLVAPLANDVVCDAGQSACTAGCRGVGGNGCPTHQACSSTSTAIGMCVQDSDDDGLADTVEIQLGTNPNDADSDHDQIGDFTETNGGHAVDTDGDQKIDARDEDSDNDCASDLTEGTNGYRDAGVPNADANANCANPTPFCNTTKGVCQPGCQSDAECGAAGSGKVCDASNQTCVNGCRGTGGNGCPSGFVCSSITSAIGACLADSDLDGLSDVLEATLGTSPQDADTDHDQIGDFVETNGGFPIDTDADGTIDAKDSDSDNDCASDLSEGLAGWRDPKVPNTDPSANCSAPTPSCDVTDGTCHGSCATDADCGSVTSGRVCDGDVSICANGCRGENGNGCPVGQVCTSSTSAIGSCVAAADGGVDAGDAGADGATDDAGDASDDGATGDAGDDGATGDASDDGATGDAGDDGALADGATDGSADGATDGSADGATDGSADGATDGSADGATDGSADGSADGATDAADAGKDASRDGEAGPPEPGTGAAAFDDGSLEGGGLSCSTHATGAPRSGAFALAMVGVMLGIAQARRRRRG